MSGERQEMRLGWPSVRSFLHTCRIWPRFADLTEKAWLRVLARKIMWACQQRRDRGPRVGIAAMTNEIDLRLERGEYVGGDTVYGWVTSCIPCAHVPTETRLCSSYCRK